MKLKVLVVMVAMLLVGVGSVSAEAPEMVWSNTFDGSISSVCSTPDGGYLLAGPSANAWIAKIDSQGNKEWTKTYGSNEGQFISITKANEGDGYIAAGWTKVKISLGNIQHKILVTKINSQGDKVWSKTYDGIMANSILRISDGYLMTGHRSEKDGFLIKLDSNGNKKWEKSFGSPESIEYTSEAQQTKDGFILIGNIGYSYLKKGYPKAWLIKTDSKGGEEWDKAFNQSPFAALEKTDDGNYVVAASKSPREGFSESNYYDVWVIKVDSHGNKLWENRFNISPLDFVGSIKKFSGGYLIAGQTNYSNRLCKPWLVKISSEGNEEWNLTLEQRRSLGSVQPTQDGEFILALNNMSQESKLIKFSTKTPEKAFSPGFEALVSLIGLVGAGYFIGRKLN